MFKRYASAAIAVFAASVGTAFAATTVPDVLMGGTMNVADGSPVDTVSCSVGAVQMSAAGAAIYLPVSSTFRRDGSKPAQISFGNAGLSYYSIPSVESDVFFWEAWSGVAQLTFKTGTSGKLTFSSGPANLQNGAIDDDGAFLTFSHYTESYFKPAQEATISFTVTIPKPSAAINGTACSVKLKGFYLAN